MAPTPLRVGDKKAQPDPHPRRTAATPQVEARVLYHSPERPVHGQGTFEWAASGCV